MGLNDILKAFGDIQRRKNTPAPMQSPGTARLVSPEFGNPQTIGNTETAREMEPPDMPRVINAPMGIARPGLPGEGTPQAPQQAQQPQPSQPPPAPSGVQRAVSAPPMPDAPTPAATQPPQAFTPMPPKRILGSAPVPKSDLLGQAGGLLGGGLGVRGAGGAPSLEVSALIQALLQRTR